MPLSKAKDKERKRLVRLDSNLIVSLSVQPSKEHLPRYNPAIHRPGDKVLIQRGKQWMPYLVPQLDAGGQSIPDYW